MKQPSYAYRGVARPTAEELARRAMADTGTGGFPRAVVRNNYHTPESRVNSARVSGAVTAEQIIRQHDSSAPVNRERSGPSGMSPRQRPGVGNIRTQSGQVIRPTQKKRTPK